MGDSVIMEAWIVNELERLMDFVKSGEGSTVVVCPSDDRVTAVICKDGDEGIFAEYFRVPHDEARKAVKKLKQQKAIWGDVPVLRVETNAPDLDGAVINAAPVVFAIWMSGDGWYIDELCDEAHAEDGNWGGTGATLVQPFVRRDGHPVDADVFFDEGWGAGASTAAFEDWFKAAQQSKDSQVRAVGADIERTFVHMGDGLVDHDEAEPDGMRF